MDFQQFVLFLTMVGVWAIVLVLLYGLWASGKDQ